MKVLSGCQFESAAKKPGKSSVMFMVASRIACNSFAKVRVSATSDGAAAFSLATRLPENISVCSSIKIAPDDVNTASLSFAGWFYIYEFIYDIEPCSNAACLTI